MRKKIVAGNWKMNTLPAEGVELAKGVAAGRGEVCSCVNFIVCPPFTHLSMVAEALKGSDIALGAQDCATEAKGAYTGEVAAQMIAALGCKYVILGHSERRQYYGETSATLNKKMAQAYANDLTPIYCVGENLEEREAGKHFDVVKAQIEEVLYNLTEEQFRNLVIAYEPVWAIGTGKTEGVFQLESGGMKSFMKELKPGSLEDIIAGISLYRPGPMDFIPKYIKGKNDRSAITYDCPQMEPILGPTYGCIVYQEQVMQIVRDLAGYTLGRSDLVRRAMSKKKRQSWRRSARTSSTETPRRA